VRLYILSIFFPFTPPPLPTKGAMNCRVGCFYYLVGCMMYGGGGGSGGGDDDDDTTPKYTSEKRAENG
jgi:hypothetical protein